MYLYFIICKCVCVRDAVEGQRAAWLIQKHCCSLTGNTSSWEDSVLMIVMNSKSLIRALETPGLYITSKQTVITLSFPLDFFISHWYYSIISTPLSLPVTASRQTLWTKNLRMFIKSVGMIRIWLSLYHSRHLSPQTVRVECVQCLDPVWDHRRLNTTHTLQHTHLQLNYTHWMSVILFGSVKNECHIFLFNNILCSLLRILSRICFLAIFIQFL